MKFPQLKEYFKLTKDNQIKDFEQLNIYKFNPLIFSLSYNHALNLNLSGEQLYFLIINSDLKKTTSFGWCPFMIALHLQTVQNLNLTTEQIDYFIKKSDLKRFNDAKYNIFMYALESNKLNISKLNEIYELSDIKETKKTMKYIIGYTFTTEQNKFKELFEKFLEQRNIVLEKQNLSNKINDFTDCNSFNNNKIIKI